MSTMNSFRHRERFPDTPNYGEDDEPMSLAVVIVRLYLPIKTTQFSDYWAGTLDLEFFLLLLLRGVNLTNDRPQILS